MGDSLFFANPYAVDAIIFLAPISGFDLALAEDPSVNRLVSAMLQYPDLAHRVFHQLLGR